MSQTEENKKMEQESTETLLTKISQYEVILKKKDERINSLESDLKKKDLELEDTKKCMSQLEEDILEAQKIKSQRQKDTDEVESLKMKSEDTLTRAKSIIFDKTKVIKNQELQIEALNQQVDGLKDVVHITKDLLEIRNMEVKQLEIKIKCMEDKVSAEKERQDLMHKKLEQMIRFNGELKREYETQLCLFSALRERYNERELAKGVVEELSHTNDNVETAVANGQDNEVNKETQNGSVEDEDKQ